MKDFLIDLAGPILALAIMGIIWAANTGPRYMATPTAADVREAVARCERLDLEADVRENFWGEAEVACVP